MSTDSTTNDDLDLELPSIEDIQEILPPSMEDENAEATIDPAGDSLESPVEEESAPVESQEDLLEEAAAEGEEEVAEEPETDTAEAEAVSETEAEDTDAETEMPAEVSDSAQVVSLDAIAGAVEVLDEKHVKAFELAQTEFENSEFTTVVKLLEEIPVSERSSEVEKLLIQAQGMVENEENWQKAKWFVQDEEYVDAVKYLEKIPEAYHTVKITTMLQLARSHASVQIAVAEAVEKIEEYQFDKGIEIFESIPEDKLSEKWIRLLKKTKEKKERYDELKDQGSIKYQEAIVSITSEDSDQVNFSDVLAIYEEILDICPIDEEAQERLDKAKRYVKLNKEKKEFLAVAEKQLDAREYQDALETLNKIDRDVLTESIREKIHETEQIVLQIEELSLAIKDAFLSGKFHNTYKNFQELTELAPGEVDAIFEVLLREGVESHLEKLIEAANEDSEYIELLDFFIEAIEQAEFELFLNLPTSAVLNHFPEEANSLYNKLAQILSEVTEEPELFNQRIQTLKNHRRHLKTAEPNLIAWEEFLDVLEHFDEMQAELWTIKDRIVENERVKKLEELALEVAETANSALPQGEDRWDRLVTIAEGKLEHNHRLASILYSKISEYLVTGIWDPKPLTMITRKKMMQVAKTSCLSIISLEVALIAYRIWSASTLVSAIIVLTLLFGVWAGFCFIAKKIILKNMAEEDSESEMPTDTQEETETVTEMAVVQTETEADSGSGEGSE